MLMDFSNHTLFNPHTLNKQSKDIVEYLMLFLSKNNIPPLICEFFQKNLNFKSARDHKSAVFL